MLLRPGRKICITDMLNIFATAWAGEDPLCSSTARVQVSVLGLAGRQHNGLEVGRNEKQIVSSWKHGVPVPKGLNPLSVSGGKGELSKRLKARSFGADGHDLLLYIILYTHRINLKHYILTASFWDSFHFFVTPTFGVLLVVDLHSSVFLYVVGRRRVFSHSLSPSGTETGDRSFTELENPASTSPKDGLNSLWHV